MILSNHLVLWGWLFYLFHCFVDVCFLRGLGRQFLCFYREDHISPFCMSEDAEKKQKVVILSYVAFLTREVSDHLSYDWQVISAKQTLQL